MIEFMKRLKSGTPFFKRGAGEANPQLQVDEGNTSLLDFMECEPLKSAFRDAVEPESLARDVARQFDCLDVWAPVGPGGEFAAAGHLDRQRERLDDRLVGIPAKSPLHLGRREALVDIGADTIGATSVECGHLSER